MASRYVPSRSTLIRDLISHSRSKQGGDDTFGSFPEHLRAMVSHALPDIEVAALTYPKFETRGDLLECVGRFREWYAAA